MTALVATSRITHATPASFNSHVSHRDFENDIAVQQTLGFHPVLGGRTVDIMMGGGRCHFLPLSSGGGVGSCRKDDRDLVAEGRAKMNWTVATTRKEFDAIENVNQVE